MKKFNLLVLLLFITLGLNANNGPKTNDDSRCRMDSAELNLCENIPERIKSDLLTGTWSEYIEVNALNAITERVYEFKEIGIVEIITFYENGQSELTRKIWRVNEANNKAYLTLTDTGSDEPNTYLMEQTCQGMILKDKLLSKAINWIVQ